MAPTAPTYITKSWKPGFGAAHLLIMILSSVGAFGFGLIEFGEAASITGFVVFVPSYYYVATHWCLSHISIKPACNMRVISAAQTSLFT